MDFLSHFDLFKVQVFFYFKGKTRQSSLAGALLSLMIFGFLIYQFALSEFFVKQSPIVLTQSIGNAHASPIYFDKKRPLLFAFSNKHTLERFMDPYALQIMVSINVNGTSTLIPSHPCEFEELKESMNQSYFKFMQLDKAYCLDEKNFYLEGFIDEFWYKSLLILVLPCNNLTSNGLCKPPEEIKQIIKTTIASIIYESVEIDANDYKNPLKTRIIPPTVNLNPSIKKYHLLYLQNVEVKTDDSWLFAGTNIQKSTGITLENYLPDIDLRESDDEALAAISIFASKKSVGSSRVYQKLPEALASIAGMANLFLVIGIIICRLICYVASMKYILNKLYYFEKFDKKGKINYQDQRKSTELVAFNSPAIQTPRENLQKKSKFSVIKPTTINKNQFQIEVPKLDSPHGNSSRLQIKFTHDHSENIQSERVNQIDLKEDSFIMEKYSQEEVEQNKPQRTTEKIETEQINTPIIEKNIKENYKEGQFESLISINNLNQGLEINQPIYLSLCEYLKYSIKKVFCCKKTEKESLIHKAEKIYRNELDIANILTKLHEIENLKRLILDSDQIVLFNYLTKPHVSLKALEQDFLFRKLENEKINQKKFRECYLKCNDMRNKNEISKKLVDFCDLKKVDSLKKPPFSK